MKKGSLFILLSIIFLSSITAYYGYRLVHFYELAHAEKNAGMLKLNDVIANNVYDKSMIKENNDIYYSGNILNNYLFYSNRYYRIIGIVNNDIVLVDETQTVLSYNEDFESSDIYNWLNKTDKEYSGIYYNSLSNKDLLTKTKTCIDEKCETYIESDVGLLSEIYYDKATNDGNYLNNNTFYWLSNKKVISYNGEKQDSSIDSYGIRPVITLKSDVLYYGGTGTFYNPYFVTKEDALLFDNIESNNKIEIGSYIKYSNTVWRVIEIDDKIKLVSTKSIGKKMFSEYYSDIDEYDETSVIYYLNNEYYNTLDKTLLEKTNFNIGTYNNSYTDKYNTKISLYVGIPEIGNLFMNDTNDYYTFVNNYFSVFKYINGKLYEDYFTSENEIIPVISIKKDIKISSGFGTLDSPYEVEL